MLAQQESQVAAARQEIDRLQGERDDARGSSGSRGSPARAAPGAGPDLQKARQEQAERARRESALENGYG